MVSASSPSNASTTVKPRLRQHQGQHLQRILVVVDHEDPSRARLRCDGQQAIRGGSLGRRAQPHAQLGVTTGASAVRGDTAALQLDHAADQRHRGRGLASGVPRVPPRASRSRAARRPGATGARPAARAWDGLPAGRTRALGARVGLQGSTSSGSWPAGCAARAPPSSRNSSRSCRSPWLAAGLGRRAVTRALRPVARRQPGGVVPSPRQARGRASLSPWLVAGPDELRA